MSSAMSEGRKKRKDHRTTPAKQRGCEGGRSWQGSTCQVDTTGVGGHVPVRLRGPKVLHAPMAWRCRGWRWSVVGEGPLRAEC